MYTYICSRGTIVGLIALIFINSQMTDVVFFSLLLVYLCFLFLSFPRGYFITDL
jgi:hypothetical protein